MENNEEITKKPLLFIEKYKELTELRDSMSKDEMEVLLCGLEYLELHDRYPKYIPL